MTTLIDGKAYAADLTARVGAEVKALTRRYAIQPGLAVVLVGDDPASQIYVRNKGRQTTATGMRSFEHKLPEDTTQEVLLELIVRLNTDNGVNGILVQLPLPEQIDAEAVIDAISPDKDVDGFHLINVGRLSIGAWGMVPCTPLGCLMLLEQHLGCGGLPAFITHIDLTRWIVTHQNNSKSRLYRITSRQCLHFGTDARC